MPKRCKLIRDVLGVCSHAGNFSIQRFFHLEIFIKLDHFEKYIFIFSVLKCSRLLEFLGQTSSFLLIEVNENMIKTIQLKIAPNLLMEPQPATCGQSLKQKSLSTQTFHQFLLFRKFRRTIDRCHRGRRHRPQPRCQPHDCKKVLIKKGEKMIP